MPTDIGGLADSLLKVSVENPSRWPPEGPVVNTRHKVSELDVGPHQHVIFLQLDIGMVQDLSRPPPP